MVAVLSRDVAVLSRDGGGFHPKYTIYAYIAFFSSIFLLFVGLISFIFSFIIFIFMIGLFFRPKNILIINTVGLIDNSTPSSIGFIHWEKVKSLSIKARFNQKFIIVEIDNPDDILTKATSKQKEYAKSMYLNVGSYIAISTQFLKENPTYLLKTLQEYLDYYRINNFTYN